MSDWYQIHCVKIENIRTSSSVQGHVNGQVIDGHGHISGETYTMHTSQIIAGGRVYQFRQKNISYPFTEGEDMVFLCEEKNGIFWVISLLNNTNGTQVVSSPVGPLLQVWKYAGLSLLTLIVYIGIVLAPIMIGYAIYYTLKLHPHVKEAYRVFYSLRGAKTKTDIERVLTGYKGTTVVAGY